MGRAKTPSFVTELPLQVSPAQERTLLVRLDAARQVYNACLGESLKRLDLLRQSKAYQAARKMPRGRKRSHQAKERARAFGKANAAVGFREYDLHAYAAQFNHSWIGEHLDINTIQTLATRAFKAVQQYAFGRRGRPRFKGRNQMDSVEGKSNAFGIRWRDDHIEWLKLHLQTVIDLDDPVIAHGLNSRVKFARIVRRKLNGRNRFYVQLVCEGEPYHKPEHEVGEGVVGLDIGPSTIAVVGPDGAFLGQFCAELEDRQAEIHHLQRKLDRQRRANNPDNYNPNGTIKRGPKRWCRSARQRRTETKLAELHRKQAAHRESLHGQMVHRILRMGDVIQMEKLSYRAFQRCFGRSVGMRAPGKFVEHLKRKAESAGAEVIEFSTRTTRLSQVCHGCGTVEKKSLSQRWHECDCGVKAQRDLYSAFLAMCVEDDRLNAAHAQTAWPGADALLQAALSDAQERAQPANGRPVPSSFGFGQRQSRLPGNSSANAVEVQDVVPPIAPPQRQGEPGKGCGTARTPRL
jgi:putative transposase